MAGDNRLFVRPNWFRWPSDRSWIVAGGAVCWGGRSKYDAISCNFWRVDDAAAAAVLFVGAAGLREIDPGVPF